MEINENSSSYEEMILVRVGEIVLKGANRGKFYQQLIKNIRYRLRDLGKFYVQQSQSRIWISAKEGLLPAEEIILRLESIFGIVSVSKVRRFPSGVDNLWQQLNQYGDELFLERDKTSFKIETKRQDKSFPLDSYEISSEGGFKLLSRFPDKLTVDVHAPEITIYIEVREQIYLYAEKIDAQKGLPVGMSGKGLVLLSGGIDSPVAAWMMASRGMSLDAIYFHTPPYTSDLALEKVLSLAGILAAYLGNFQLHIVDFTEVQLELNNKSPKDMLTIVMRRMMMRIASEIARKNKQKALITGESLGQVASQTLEALITTEEATDLLVLRPLIGMDKDEIVATARKIGSYEASIMPYEDCCTVFVAKHPKTHPDLADAYFAEEELDIDALVSLALDKTETRDIYLRDSF